MLFSYDKPKSQAYRVARFEAIQHLKKTQHSLNLNIVNNLTKKIYNNESDYSASAHEVDMMIKKIKNANFKPNLNTRPIVEININMKKKKI